MDAIEVVGQHVNIQQFGYLLLFLYCLGGGFIGIIAASVLSSVGKMDINLTIGIAILGNMIGSTFYAYVSRFQKKEIMKFFKKHRRKVAFIQIQLRKHDWYILIFSKYIHGIRAIVPLAVGVSNYSLKKFFLINSIGCIIWGLAIGYIAYHASGYFLIVIKFLLENKYLFPIVMLGIILLVMCIYYLIKYRIGLKKNIK